MSRRPAALASLALVALIASAGCDGSSGAGQDPRTGPAGAAGPGGGSEPVPGSATREPGVIQGRITTLDGRPIEGAEVRIIGYTDAVGRQHDDLLVTAADGGYRAEVEDGLYEVSAEALLAFDGQVFRMPLHPADGGCDEEESAAGIVEDWVLRLAGERACLGTSDPAGEDAYYGAVVHLSPDLASSAPGDGVIEVTFVPEVLADGSAGSPVVHTRTVAALTTTAGPLEATGTLVDIPLGRYTVSATLRDATGTTPLLVQSQDATSAGLETPLGFRAAEFFPYGVQDQTLWLLPPEGRG
jgi:hypothetical protein